MKRSFCVLTGNLFQQFYTLVDRVIVGRFVGPDAFSAVGAANALSMVFMSMCMGMTMGTSIVVSQYAGSKDGKNIGAAIVNGARDSMYALINSVVEIFSRIGFSVGLTSVPTIGIWGIWLTTGLTWFATALFALFNKKGTWKEKVLV